MEEKKYKTPEYINPDNPVYISYAWDRNDKDLEYDVNKLCKLMEANGIFYKRDKGEGENCSVPYRYNIDEAEKEIGKGDIIVVVLSLDYLRSLHCMYEWHCICKTGNIAKRVFPIILPGINLIDDKPYEWACEVFYKRYEDLYTKSFSSELNSKKEIELVNNRGYLSELRDLRDYLMNHNILSVESLRKSKYSEIITQIKERVTSAVGNREQNDYNQHVMKGNEVAKVDEMSSSVETQEVTNSLPTSSLSVEEYDRLTELLFKKLLKDNMNEDENGEKDALLTNNFILIIRSLEKLKEIVIHHKELNTKFFNFLCKYIQARTRIQGNEIYLKEVEWLSQSYTYKIEKLLPYDIQLAITMFFDDCRELFGPIQEKVNFSCLDLKCSKFLGKEMEVKNINFSWSMLQYSRMYGKEDKSLQTTFENCIFDHAFLDASHMSYATFNNCSFVDTNMRWANMYGVKLNNCRFIGCQMTGVILSEAHISECTFENCKIDAVELMDVHFETPIVMKHCNFCFAYIYSKDIFKKINVKFESCHFDGVGTVDRHYKIYGRIKRFLLHQQNIMKNDDKINETPNMMDINDRKKAYYMTMKEIRDYCLPNTIGVDNEEIRFFVEGQYDKIKV